MRKSNDMSATIHSMSVMMREEMTRQPRSEHAVRGKAARWNHGTIIAPSQDMGRRTDNRGVQCNGGHETLVWKDLHERLVFSADV